MRVSKLQLSVPKFQRVSCEEYNDISKVVEKLEKLNTLFYS